MHWLDDFSLFSATVGVGDAGIPEHGFYQLVLTVVLLLVVGILHRRVSPPPAPSASRSDPRGVVGRGTSFVGDAGGRRGGPRPGWGLSATGAPAQEPDSRRR
jgi:hypothetical protein